LEREVIVLESFIFFAKSAAEQTIFTNEFWGMFAGFIFLFFAIFEGAKRFGIMPASKTEKHIQFLASGMKNIIPEGMDFEKTPLGKALALLKENSEQTERLDKIHEIPSQIGVTPNWYCGLKDQTNKNLLESMGKEHTLILEELKKLSDFDAETTVHLSKIIKIMSVQTERLKLIQKRSSSASREIDLLELEENG
jgi:hypothetical protein